MFFVQFEDCSGASKFLGKAPKHVIYKENYIKLPMFQCSVQIKNVTILNCVVFDKCIVLCRTLYLQSPQSEPERSCVRARGHVLWSVYGSLCNVQTEADSEVEQWTQFPRLTSGRKRLMAAENPNISIHTSHQIISYMVQSQTDVLEKKSFGSLKILTFLSNIPRGMGILKVYQDQTAGGKEILDLTSPGQTTI